jgi:hypothetical protein
LVLFFKKELLVFTYFFNFLDGLGVTFFVNKKAAKKLYEFDVPPAGGTHAQRGGNVFDLGSILISPLRLNWTFHAVIKPVEQI